ncbi:hypothetical protein D082_01450 [Synechocystis sp. PCC 6714]|nr:hypothetical protein D082_01450 [Synechocystis sp. PCC 6714]
MFVVPNRAPKLTPIEYFAWEEQQLHRHEYIKGEVYAMGGGTQNHSRISLKVAALLDSHLSNGPCRVFIVNQSRIEMAKVFTKEAFSYVQCLTLN